MEFQEKKTANYNIHIFKNNKFKRTRLTVLFRLEKTKQNIMYANLLCRVMNMGNSKYPTVREKIIGLRNLYNMKYDINFDVILNELLICFDFDYINEDYTEAGITDKYFELINNVIFNPKVKDKAIDEFDYKKASEELITLLTHAHDNPNTVAWDNYYKLMYCDSVMPSDNIKIVNKIDAKKLYRFYKKIINNSKVDVLVYGDVEDNKIIPYIKKYINFKKRTEKVYPLEIETRKYYKNIKNKKIKFPSNQSILIIGYRVNEPTYIEKQVTAHLYNFILGGSANSKLFEIVREKNSLCYNIWSGQSPYPKTMHIYCGIDKKNKKKTVNLINELVDSMKSGNFTDKDLNDMKLCYKTALLESEDFLEKSFNNAFNQTFYNKMSIEKRLETCDKVTKEDVILFANKIEMQTVMFLEGVKNDD